MIEKTILVRYGEIHLKGNNRPFFERKLEKNMAGALKAFANVSIERTQGRYFIKDYAPADESAIIDALTRVFGIHSISPAVLCEKDWDEIGRQACLLMEKQVEKHNGHVTFKVFARRSDKSFPIDSTTMAPELGGIILERVPGTKVDIHHYQIALGVEIREKAYLYSEVIMGPGGMPTGCNGRATLLLSGGIDSPVAGHMMMKRGLEIDCVHFHSFPYTSERARDKVIDLARILSRYCGRIRLYIVSITDFQLAVYEKCPSNHMTVLLRRGMMQVTERIALQTDSKALITGEAVGQVASQTLESLHCTNSAVSLPVLRPCIGFDKLEIVERAQAIGSYETSILPYEDCCTIFTPKHPATKPSLERILESQAMLPEWDNLLDATFQGHEKMILTPYEESELF